MFKSKAQLLINLQIAIQKIFLLFLYIVSFLPKSLPFMQKLYFYMGKLKSSQILTGGAKMISHEKIQFYH